MVACPQCQALVPDIDGPIHEYFGASPGCWKIYGEVLAKEYGEQQYMKVHRLTVDAYAVQHPGSQDPRAIQSVNVHLLALHLVFERGCDFKFATQALSKIIEKRKGSFLWLEPPPFLGEVKVTDVLLASQPDEHVRLVNDWAISAWKAWAKYHPQISELAKEVL